MRSSLVRNGLKITVTLNEPGSISATLMDPRRRELSRPTSGLASMPLGGTHLLTLRLTPAGKARARRTKRIRWVVQVLATDGRGNQTTKRVQFKLG